ncbi:hypothetical protein, partial [Aquicoccus sp.]|uniref:hypothetical protein n=1 Tax=Aquicoccus sp. TaxID=2055851 RepID=UPI003564AF34
QGAAAASFMRERVGGPMVFVPGAQAARHRDKQCPMRAPATSFIASRFHRPVKCVQCDPRRRAAFLKDGQQQRAFVTSGNVTTELRGGAITDCVEKDLADVTRVIA